MILRARQQQIEFPRPAMVMGIVNVTPDSFSDGGRYSTVDQAVRHGLELVSEGAEIIDVGGESTRPGAMAVTAEEEMARVVPVIRELAGKVKAVISVDTMKPSVARAAVEAGALIVNDVATNSADPEMARVLADTGAAYVLMHMQGVPRTMQASPVYSDVVGEVSCFFDFQMSRLMAAGVDAEQIVLDVGIGFGKLLEHNLRLVGQISRFNRWNRPVLLGVSKKTFIGQHSGAPVEKRLPGSLACACWAVQNGVQIIRVHDVAATIQAVRMTEALMAQEHDDG